MQIRQESSTYTGIRSYIVFLYRESGVQMPAVVNESLSLYIKGSHNKLDNKTNYGITAERSK